MKMLAKLFLSFALLGSLLFIAACEDTKVQSTDEGPSPLDVDVNVESNNLLLRAAPQQTVVDLDWDAVSGAVDYEVTRQLQEDDSEEIIAYTEGATEFSFATSAGQTYLVRVAALNQNDLVIKLSKVLTVSTGSANAIQKSDEGL